MSRLKVAISDPDSGRGRLVGNTTPTVSGVPIIEDLAKQLARAAGQIEKAQNARDELILLAFAQGASLREIAEVAGLTHVGVKRLVERLEREYVIVDGEGNVLSIIEAKQSVSGSYLSRRDHAAHHQFQLAKRTGSERAGQPE